MKNDTLEKRMRLEHLRSIIPDHKLKMGSIIDKYPVVLDDGRTVVYISDKSKEAETRLKFESHKNSRLPYYSESNIS